MCSNTQFHLLVIKYPGKWILVLEYVTQPSLYGIQVSLVICSSLCLLQEQSLFHFGLTSPPKLEVQYAASSSVGIDAFFFLRWGTLL